MGELLPLLLEGAWVTVQVTFFGSLLAVALAIVAALGRLAPWPAVRWLAIGYIELFRGTSLLVQLFWLFFVLPLPPFNLELGAYTVAILGLGLHIGAYGAEVMRGAIGSVPKGQYEAALALNMTPFTRFRRIILPSIVPAAAAGAALSFARAMGEYGSLVLLSGNLPNRTEVASVRILTYIENGNNAGAAAIATLLLVIALLVIVLLDVIQRRVARRG